MNKNIFALSVFVFFILTRGLLFASEQEKPIPFEEKYKDRDALVVLYDMSVKVNDDWSYITKLHIKKKVLKEEAKELGEIPLYYEKNWEKVTEALAFTFTPEGKKHGYVKVQDINLYEGYPMYSDSMVKIMTLPEVTIGSTLEEKYTIVSKGMHISNAYWNYFDFNFSYPTKEFNFSITLPKKLAVQYKEFNLSNNPKITEDASRITYSWHRENIGTKEETQEGYLPPPTVDSITDVVEFSSIKNWAEVSNWYYSLVKKNLKVTPEIQETAQSLAKDFTNTRDKVRAMLEYIQKNFRYVSMSFGDNTLEPHPTDQVFKNKYGDCKDLSLLCMAMLESLGIKSYIALFRSEFSISDPLHDLPIPSLFNHVILLVEDNKKGDFYIDPLLKGYDISQYPMGYQAAYTFIITSDGGRFGRMPVFKEERRHAKSKNIITIGEDGSALIETDSLWDLDVSVGYRQDMKAMNDEEKEKFNERLDNYIASGGQLLERRIDGLEDKYGLLKSHTKVSIKDLYQITDGMMIIDLYGFDRSNDFLNKERKNPIFYAYNDLDEETKIYRIPKGFRISYMPNNLNLDIRLFSINREYTRKGREIIVKETKRGKRIELPKEEYKKVKDFFDQLSVKTKQRIMLKKLKPWHESIKEFFGKLKERNRL